MDKLDLAILESIQHDASLSTGDLAEKVGISKSACWRRMQKLSSDGVIKTRVAILDSQKLNLPLTVYISIRTNEHNAKWATKFQKVTQKIPGVLEVYRMSGDLDYLVKAVVTDMKGYDDLYKQLIEADLFDVSSSFVMETMKQTTELPLSHAR
ncbi:MAG: Lrp/AsnC family transcriptional regulator [Pseudohongiellaceae bacterium]